MWTRNGTRDTARIHPGSDPPPVTIKDRNELITNVKHMLQYNEGIADGRWQIGTGMGTDMGIIGHQEAQSGITLFERMTRPDALMCIPQHRSGQTGRRTRE